MLRVSLEDTPGYHELVGRLMPGTVQNAQRSKLFHGKLGVADRFLNGSLKWNSIPFTTRADVVAAGDLAFADANSMNKDYYTGGTTGRAFAYQVSDTEQEFLNQFFPKTFRDGVFRRGIRLWDGSQFGGRSVPVPIRFHDISIYTPGAMEHVSRILLHDYSEPNVQSRCSIYGGGQRVSRALASWLNHYGRDSAGDLDLAFVYGMYLTDFARRLVSDALGCRVIDRYGLSEVIGGATECQECGWHHFDATAYAEVVDVQTGIEISSGIGILVLTPLFPFQQRLPLIRYYTGDVVEVTTIQSCEPGRLSIRPKGRLSQSVRDKEGFIILTEADILESVDPAIWIGREATLHDCQAIDQTWPIGRPLFNAIIDQKAGERSSITLTFPERRRECPPSAKSVLELCQRLESFCRSNVQVKASGF